MQDTDTVRLTVKDAAKLLGISAEAVRQRIGRNTLRHEKVGTTVYVLLDQIEIDQLQADTDGRQQDANQTALIKSQQEQITYLRQQLDREQDANRENRRIIAGLIERVPELPSATQPEQERTSQESGEDAAQQTSKDVPNPNHHGVNREAQRPFWKRLFG